MKMRELSKLIDECIKSQQAFIDSFETKPENPCFRDVLDASIYRVEVLRDVSQAIYGNPIYLKMMIHNQSVES